VRRSIREAGSCALALVLLMALSHSVVLGVETQKVGVCAREGAAVVGRKPLATMKGMRALKKLRDVKPAYPELPEGTQGSGVWVGEVLVAANGKVARIWPLREVQFSPPFPRFNQAIVSAIDQWEFEPALVNGEPTPVCVTTTVNINWR